MNMSFSFFEEMFKKGRNIPKKLKKTNNPVSTSIQSTDFTK